MQKKFKSFKSFKTELVGTQFKLCNKKAMIDKTS